MALPKIVQEIMNQVSAVDVNGDSMVGTLTVANSPDGARSKGIRWGDTAQMGSATSGELGIYSKSTIYIRPGDGTVLNTTEGVVLTPTNFRPAKTDTMNLGSSNYYWARLYATNVTISENLTVKTLTISSTSAANHIQFSRGSANYFAAPASGYFAFLPNGKSRSIENCDFIVEPGAVHSGKTNAVTLGTDALRWSTIYTNTTNNSNSSIINRTSAGGGLYLQLNGAQYGRFAATTAGTAGDGSANGTAGICTLYLGNATSISSTSGEGANNAYGRILFYADTANYNILRSIAGISANYTNYLPARTGVLLNTNVPASTAKRYVMGVSATGSTSTSAAVNANSSIYTSGSVLYGAAWNDYAEYRNQIEDLEAGYCVASLDNGKVYKTTERLQCCDGIVSDTFGYAIGETEDCRTPLAVSGRVLAYYEGDRKNYHSGDIVAAGPEGKVIKMTREEIQKYPDRIIGHVSEIPEYETWGAENIKVNNRIWIKIK